VTTGDLPGTTNPFGRTQPVVVLDDPLTGSDEGRGMMQIVHDEAPGSRLGFATASDGQVSFADNIRSLAGLPNGTKRQAGFACDVIVDDLYYSDSPMFGTSLVGRAVNEVAAAGVAYFSSAGNRPGQNGYFSDFRRVPAEDLTAAVAGTNLNFANVPADLYAGGFHDFDPTAAQDIAQTISQGETTSTSRISFQWDDPYDVDPPTFNPTPFFTATGTQSSTTVPVDFTLAGLTAGQQYRVTVIRTAGSNLDAVVEVRDPNGKLLLRQDTGFDEEVFFFAPISGDYKVSVYAFAADAAHTGAFEINAYLASGTPRVTSDFNLLFFRLDGTYYTSMSANNIASNQPIEIGALPFNATDGRRLQLVIARANIPTAPVVASRFRYVCTVVGGPIEYFDVLTPITFGHNHEPGCISAAAYSPFKPYVPEDFTSPGPSYIYFDEAGNRLAQPIIRQKPDVAAQDNVNTTFFGSDSASDADTQPNFSGTSAAAPSAAGIAALVLQANGGPGSVTAAQMKTILQRSGFKHDLDPLFASGTIRTATGGKLSITARGFTGTGNYSDGRNVTTADLRSFGVSYVGPGSVNGISLNVSNANPNGGTDVTPNPGLVWDNRARTTTAASGFPFTVGSTTGGITAGNITAAYTLPAPAPAVAGQFFQLELTFATGALTGGRGFTFGADRDEEQTANLTTPSTGFGNSADLLGANVSLDTNEVTPGGTTIAGTTSDGQPYSGTIVNRIGKGYSPLDGYGFINAQEAVAQPLP
jgi:hypothetical protein